FVVGAVAYVSALTLVNSVVGDTDFYGPLYGLAVTSGANPGKMVLKNSFTTAPLAWVTPAFEETPVASLAAATKHGASAARVTATRHAEPPLEAKLKLIRRAQQSPW